MGDGVQCSRQRVTGAQRQDVNRALAAKVLTGSNAHDARTREVSDSAGFGYTVLQ